MILDDGGDATLLVHKGVESRRPGVRPHPPPTTTRKWTASSACSSRTFDERPDKPHWHKIAKGIKGVSEETTTGVHRLYEMAATGSCCSRPSTSTTRSPSPSSTTSTAAASRWSTASSAPPT
jgi:adenosylhomocysteinase